MGSGHWDIHNNDMFEKELYFLETWAVGYLDTTPKDLNYYLTPKAKQATFVAIVIDMLTCNHIHGLVCQSNWMTILSCCKNQSYRIGVLLNY